MDYLPSWIRSVQSGLKGYVWEEEEDFVEEGERDVVVEDVLKEPGIDDSDLSKIASLTDRMGAKHFSPRALREMLVNGPLKEFNRPEFFMAIQLAILFYYPTIALGIMYQQTETQDTMQPTDEQIEQMMQSMDTQSTITQSSIEQFVQFVRMIQSMITRTQPCTQKNAVSKMAMTEQAVVTTTNMDTMMMRGDGEGVRVEVMIKVPDQGTSGEGRQEETTTVWNTVYITF